MYGILHRFNGLWINRRFGHIIYPTSTTLLISCWRKVFVVASCTYCCSEYLDQLKTTTIYNFACLRAVTWLRTDKRRNITCLGSAIGNDNGCLGMITFLFPFLVAGTFIPPIGGA